MFKKLQFFLLCLFLFGYFNLLGLFFCNFSASFFSRSCGEVFRSARSRDSNEIVLVGCEQFFRVFSIKWILLRAPNFFQAREAKSSIQPIALDPFVPRFDGLSSGFWKILSVKTSDIHESGWYFLPYHLFDQPIQSFFKVSITTTAEFYLLVQLGIARNQISQTRPLLFGTFLWINHIWNQICFGSPNNEEYRAWNKRQAGSRCRYSD